MSARHEEAPAGTGAPNEMGQPTNTSLATVAEGGTVGNDVNTQLAKLDEYDRGRFNVLHPIVVQVQGGASSDFLVESVSVLQIDGDDGGQDVYHDFRYANKDRGKAALTSHALGKIAIAAGIKWIPENCRVIDRQRRPDGHRYVCYQAAAAVRQLNGEWHVETAVKEIDTEDVADKLRDQDERQVARGNKNWTEAQIEERVRQQIMQLREHLASHAETKAKSRVIRRLLSLKQVYTQQELARPFVVPRLVYRPDLLDPRQLEQVQIEGHQATEALYGDSSLSSTGQGELGEGDGPPAEADGPGVPTSGQAWDAAVVEPPRSPDAGGAGPEASGEGVTGPASDGPTPPTSDPIITQQGEWKDKHVSEAAHLDPGYIRRLRDETRSKTKREIYTAWLSYWGTDEEVA